LSPARRPTLIGYGLPPPGLAHLADDWGTLSGGAAELAARLPLAVERGRARRSVARRSLTDPLTRVANRRGVVQALLRESGRARRDDAPVGLVLIDLDEFKAVNERGGHPAGDRVLRAVGLALRRATRSNEIVGRIGGDEFAVVVNGGHEAVTRTVSRLRRALRRIGVAASAAGCVLRPGERLRELYRRTDAALDRDKRLRRAALALARENRSRGPRLVPGEGRLATRGSGTALLPASPGRREARSH
jgi:diguanylate cyclase (GGDEF)-like protein